MQAKLHPNVRAQFEASLKTPFPLDYMKTDEFWRRVDVLEQTPTTVTLLLDGRAVALLDLSSRVDTHPSDKSDPRLRPI